MTNISVHVKNVSKTFKIKKSLGILNKVKEEFNKKQQKIILALDDVSFQVARGEILGIIGLNGSGKTTLLRTIAGIYQPTKGSVQVLGRLSPLMQLGTGFQNELDARENIIMNGMLMGLSKSAIEGKVENIIHYAELEKFTHLKLKHFSSGMRARLAFSSAIHIDPEILLVDEILSIGDRLFREKSYQSFLSLKKSKKTIIHTTHNLDKLSEFSDRILVLHKGKTVMIGEPKDAINEYRKIQYHSL